VTASSESFYILPGLRSYFDVTNSFTNQNFLAVTSIAPTIFGGMQGSNMVVNWHGFEGVMYQAYASTNLVDWEPYGGSIQGYGGSSGFAVPIDVDPLKFFRVEAHQ
jgi:hypothetical protein